MKQNVFRFGELFCGPGGLALAAKNASAHLNVAHQIMHAWATDYNNDTCKTYRMNICPDMPKSVICQDIRELSFARLKRISMVDAMALLVY